MITSPFIFYKNKVSPLLKQVGLVLVMSWLYALCSQIIIWLPFLPVPLSLQPAPLFLATLVLGWPAVQAYALYLVQGACGAPFFASMQGGLLWLAGPTGGYLVGFFGSMIFLAMMRPAIARCRWLLLPCLLTASALTFMYGLAQLSFFVKPENLLNAGLWPFCVGDFLIKPALVLLSLRFLWYCCDRSLNRD